MLVDLEPAEMDADDQTDGRVFLVVILDAVDNLGQCAPGGLFENEVRAQPRQIFERGPDLIQAEGCRADHQVESPGTGEDPAFLP